MQIHRTLLVLLAFAPTIARAQAPGPPPTTPAPDQPPKSLGSYSVVVTALEPSPTTHLLNPALTIDVENATELAPKEISGTKTVPPQYAIESFANPRFDCIPATPKDHGCEALDRAELTIRDANTLAYHLGNHGAAVQLAVNLLVHDLEPVSRAALEGTWHAAEVIFVAVPKLTPSFHFVSAVLAGDWDGNAIVFEPGKPLPESAKKGLEDLNIHQDLGDRILYSYKVKDPKPAK